MLYKYELDKDNYITGYVSWNDDRLPAPTKEFIAVTPPSGFLLDVDGLYQYQLIDQKIITNPQPLPADKAAERAKEKMTTDLAQAMVDNNLTVDDLVKAVKNGKAAAATAAKG